MAMEKCTIDVHEQKSIALGATESLILHWCKILLTFGVLALKVL